MGSYNFKWEHPASDVYVTGTFDNWSKSVKLEKSGSIHEKTVQLPSASEKIFYKFVADGEWKTDHTAKSEPDHEGNLNNVLYPIDLTLSAPSASISSVAPGATTTTMAAEQPIEKSPPPGAFPETPAATSDDRHGDGLLGGALAGGAAAVAGAGAAAGAAASGKKDEQTFSVNPIPASEGFGNPVHLAPGEKVPDPSTIGSNTISSTVHDDPSLKSSAKDAEQTFGVSPLPATGGFGNPIHLNPGEKVPDSSTLTGNTLTSNVKLDQASYENSSSGAPQLPPLSPQTEKEAHGAPIFGLGPQTSNMIPESSMAMGKDTPAPIEGAALSSVAPQSTTAQLAGQQPIEPRDRSAGAAAISSVGPNSTTSQLAGQQPIEPRGVPEVVSESQEKAHASPEAAANPEAVQEKKQVEDELKAKVPEEQAGSSSGSGVAAAAAGGVAALGAAAVGAGAYLRNKTHETTGTDPVSVLPQSVQDSINGTTGPSSKIAPTASASVPQQNSLGEGVSTASKATPTAVPSEVTASQKEAHVGPEATSNPVAVQEKSAVESELLSHVKQSNATGEPAPTATAATSATAPSTSASGAPQLGTVGGLAPLSLDDNKDNKTGLNAPASSQAQPSAVAASSATAEKPVVDSADISPLTSPTGEKQTEPIVTTGVDSGTAPAQSTATAGKPVGTPRGANKTAGTPQKRNSIMDRIRGGSPSASKTATGESPASGDATASGGKKKGFLSKIKEKFNKS